MIPLGKFYITHIEIVIDHIIKELHESVNTTKIIIVDLTNFHVYYDFKHLIDKYNIETNSAKTTVERKDPDDIIIRDLILDFSDIVGLKNIVVASLDGGYAQNLSIAQAKGINIYIAANDRRSHKLKIFNFIDIEAVRNAYIFQKNDNVLSTCITINMLYPKNLKHIVGELESSIQKIITNFQIDNSEIECQVYNKTKDEPLK